MRLAYIFMLFLVVTMFGCKSSAPKQQPPAKQGTTTQQGSNNNGGTNNGGTNNGGNSKGDTGKNSTRGDEEEEEEDSKSTKKKSDDSDDCDSSSSSSTRKLSYEGDIKKIITDNCISCHKTKAPVLTTYAKVKAEADDVYDSVKNKRMPEDEALAKADIDKIKKWIDDGKLEKASSSSSSSDDECKEDTKSGSTTKKTPEEQLKELLETTAFKECKADDRVYDRSGKKCLAAKVATSYKCTKEGVIEAFEKIDIDVSSNMSTILGEGYEIEQCGELEDDPVVTFLKKDLKTVTAKFRRICASGSAACQ